MKGNAFIQDLISKMTLTEKIGQLQQTTYVSDVITGDELDTSEVLAQIRQGQVGSILSVYQVDVMRELQRLAVEESRLKIPLFFAFDVIHGYRTGFPINLALAGSFDLELIENVAAASAKEASAGGMHLTFSPMVDLVRDPRWGRVMEANGEDPYLSSVLSRAYVKGYQGTDLAGSDRVAACVKHFAGYGFSEAGRDYNTVDISERVLFTSVLPPFQAAIDAGVPMVMTGFNVLFDRPATANRYLLQDILRTKMNFKGVIISDYSSTEEIIEHKVATDLVDVAEQCMTAGIDHEMGATSYQQALATLVEQKRIDESLVDQAVQRVLQLKDQMGLFDDPYRTFGKHPEKSYLQESTLQLALEAAEKSIVLLKNDAVLPLLPTQSIALIGPFADSQDVIGEWPALIKQEEAISIATAFSIAKINVDVYPDRASLKGIQLSAYERVVVAIGESGNEAGEGHSKVDLSIAKDHLELVDYVTSHHRKVVAVVFAGRPLVLTDLQAKVQGILYAYQPGTRSGDAIRNILLGDTNPSAKLVMTFPSHQGQVPIYYNHYRTGRPIKANDPMYRYRTHYIDQSNEPLYPFGYGLTYGEVVLKEARLSANVINEDQPVIITATLSNMSDREVTETLQCYIEALTYSVARPVNELKGFKKVKLSPNESKQVDLALGIDAFRSYNVDMKWTAESREYLVKLGFSSKTEWQDKIQTQER